MVRRKRPTPGWASATSPADADWQPAAPLDPAYRSAALTSPAAPVTPAVGRSPRVSAAARAATAVRPGFTAGTSSAFPYSEKSWARSKNLTLRTAFRSPHRYNPGEHHGSTLRWSVKNPEKPACSLARGVGTGFSFGVLMELPQIIPF